VLQGRAIDSPATADISVIAVIWLRTRTGSEIVTEKNSERERGKRENIDGIEKKRGEWKN